MSTQQLESIISKIDRSQMEETLWALVQIPSPTGNERCAALAFAQMLRKLGIETEIDESIYDSPAVIGRLSGNRPGKTLQLAGHIDHITVAHDPPRRTRDIIYGRGSYDMKYGLAIILEIARILKQTGCDFPGELLITVYGLHEAPNGNTRGVCNLIERGIKGDAALVFEGPSDVVPIAGNGLAQWDITIGYSEPACHETNAEPKRDDLLKTLLELVGALRKKHTELYSKVNKYPFLRNPSIFIGQIHYGDYFNRMTNECSLQGTLRWQPDQNFEQIRKEFETVIDNVSCPSQVSIEKNITFIGHSYQMSPNEPIVLALQRAYKRITNHTLPVGTFKAVTDTQRLMYEGKVSAIPWGAETSPEHSGHTDDEYVELDKMELACRILLATVCEYLDSSALTKNK
jgi:acetylornithine deacetylase/succinyl-diaminopimelate desuccinylase-like protein